MFNIYNSQRLHDQQKYVYYLKINTKTNFKYLHSLVASFPVKDISVFCYFCAQSV